ncbi:GDSL esterase/lipase At5g45670-like [Silene latifolia]|uniref:GDSL esterase/lipase At5g45670-like n=1 Tax=Silene latifolia TaxID=37657 RepID=UPI003D775AAE
MWRIMALFVSLVFMATIGLVHSTPRVPCYFIFGDSLSDVGNNNNLNTKAKANYPPYGIDFPGGVPTGRFSNGLNFVDRIAELLGFEEYIPPYSTAKLNEIVKGVNYASGAAGIRSETGQHLGDRISLDRQLANHLNTITKLTLMGKGFMLNKCLYTVNMGSNDFINNYFLPQHYRSSSVYNPEQYAEVLIRQYSRQLKKLYAFGARKVAVFGAGSIGCTLAEIYMHGTNGSLCVDSINNAAILFNQKLISLVDRLNSKLPAAQFTYINSISSDTGSAIVDNTCCKLREDFQCQESENVCDERGNYIFWDGFHTTEMANIATAEKAFNAIDANIVHPMNINMLLSTNNVAFINKTVATNYVSSSK